MNDHRPRPAALVAVNDSNSGLAAIRDLGRAGVRVMAPHPHVLSPVRFTRHLSSTVARAPAAGGTTSRLAWLLRIGQMHPGTVLMPALDELTWLIAANQDVLGRYFTLYYPAADVFYRLLNKQQLHSCAAASGLKVPAAWFPANLGDVERWAPHFNYPVVVKPATHIGSPPWLKGWLASNPVDVCRRYRQAVLRLGNGKSESEYGAGDALPFVQVYEPRARRNVYNLSGFVDHTGELTGFSATTKVLQYPQRFGVGLCFRATAVDPVLAGRLTEFVRSIGFFGMFEAEFIDVDGERQLIDFNPRIFNGLSLPAARGLRLPLIWYLAAIGDWAAVEEQLAGAREPASVGVRPAAWCYRAGLRTMVVSRLLTGCMTLGEARHWWNWVRSDRARVLDANWDPDDPWPGRLGELQHLGTLLRDPRYLVGTYVRD